MLASLVALAGSLGYASHSPSLPASLSCLHFFIFIIIFLFTLYNLFAGMLMFLLLQISEHFLKVSNIYIPSASSLGGSSIPASGL